MENKKINYKLIWSLFYIYIIILLWIVVFKFNEEWIPENSAYLRSLPIKERIMSFYPFQIFIEEGLYFELDYFMNIIIYIPLGVLLSFLINIKYKKEFIILISLFSSIIFEIIQLLTGWGGFDTTDMLCNTLGGIIGLLLMIPISKIKVKTINLFNFILLLIFLPIAIAVIINTILNYHLYTI